MLAPDVKVQARVVLIGAQDAHRHAAGDGPLELLAATDPAAVLLDQGPQGYTKLQLVAPWLLDMTRDAHQLRPVAGRATDCALDTLSREGAGAIVLKRNDQIQDEKVYAIIDDIGQAKSQHNLGLIELADSSVNFAVRPWSQVKDYWAVYFGINEKIKMALDEAGITIPFPQMDVHMDK